MINKKIFIFIYLFFSVEIYASTAVAFIESEVKYFISKDKANKQEAVESVLKLCDRKGYRDCKIVVSTEGGGYGAIAKSLKTNGSSVIAGSKTKKRAEEKVLGDCNKLYGACYLSSSWQDVGRIVEVPVQQKILTGFGCVNPYTKLGDPYCERIDVGGNRY